MEKTKKAAAKKTTEAAHKNKFIYAKGSRKTATAQIRFFENGKGEYLVNGLPYGEYFRDEDMRNIVISPLKLAAADKAGFSAKVSGGGKKSQAEACRHGLARALVILDQANRPALKAAGFMTRDPRSKERKKPGLKRARRAPQWSKR